MKFHSIKTQLTAIYTSIIIFFILCVSLLVELLSSNALIQKSILSANRELRLLNEKVELFANNIETISLYLIQIQNNESFSEPYESFLYTSGILSFLQDFIITTPSVDSVSFYDQQGTVMFSDMKSNSSHSYDNTVSYIEEFKKEDINTKWINFHHFQSPASQSSDWGCSFLRKAYSYTGDFLGIFELNISEDALHSIYDIAIADNYSFYILDQDQNVASAMDKSLLHLSLEELKEIYPVESTRYVFHSSSNYLYTTYTNESLNWTLVSTLPVSVILAETQKLVLSIFVVGFFAIVLAFFLLNWITRFITRPLIDLTSTVEKIADGNYSIQADSHTPNEIGRLATQVNLMSHNTLHLLNRIETESDLKRQFELSYIQLQMTPHFLYNTLESICGMIAVDEKKKAIKMIQNLSSFYRKILTRGAPIVTLEQELEITQCYLDILRQRYCEIYTYEIHIVPEANTYLFPKLTFQPFVENALIHGILPTEHAGHIDISIDYVGDKLVISISDDGQGMEKEVLDRLNRALSEKVLADGKETGFGIVNTYHRLALFLNEPDIDISIQSSPDSGTRIKLMLPATQKGNLRKEIDEYYV